MSKMKIVATSLGAVVLFSGTAHAGSLYSVNDFGSGNQLLKIDPVTLAVTPVGNLGVGGDFGDLAYDQASNTMYWVDGRGARDSLYTINLSTGAASYIGTHGVGDMFSLGWDGTNLYAQSTNQSVYTLNTTTGAATAIGNNSVYPGGYDFNTANNTLVSIEAGGGGIYSIDRTNGSATFLGGNGSVNDSDIAYDDDRKAYWVIDWSGNLFKYDSTTFVRTTELSSGLGVSSSIEYVGAVPEPETYAMLLAGLGILGAFHRRRKSS